jgi:exo-1,4-beta-D-glucosaminidase
MRNKITLSFLILTIFASNASAQHDLTADPARVQLRTAWQLQSSCKTKDKGDAISTATYKPQTKDWLAATVPTTVLAAQVAAGLFPDPYFGMNLRDIPGTSYPIGKMFANLPMPEDSPYACSWWYRTEFTAPPDKRTMRDRTLDRQVWLHFGGISYRGNVWLNGKQIADAQHMAGMWREFEYNVTSSLVHGANTLAVEVFAQKEDDLGITFVDWNPMPPDKDMGLWRPVDLSVSGPVAVRHGFVTSKLSADLKTAVLTATIELTNASDRSVEGNLQAVIATARVQIPVKLAAQEVKTVKLSGEDRRELVVANPRLWWPAGMGGQEVYAASFKFLVANTVSDAQNLTFAIRSVTSELTPEGYRLFRVNGRPFLVRGGGWTPDMMLRQSPERLAAEFRYVRDMNLNTVRLEGKLETNEFFEMADRMGVMVMAGWCCCDHWEHWDKWKPEDYEISAASLADQIRRLRNHPSLLVWLNGSDNPPPPNVETRYIEVLTQYDWPNPFISSATAKPTTVTGNSGVKMSGPYDYVPPAYWQMDTAKLGGGYGFNTETSPGAAIPPAQCVKQMIPPDHLWPVDDVWNYHAGAGSIFKLDLYNHALSSRYGESPSLVDYATKSQASAYDGERAMFEAYIRNRYTMSPTGVLTGGPATGVIQWMLNNAWPSMIWHLYDYFLQPAGGYFGAKKANEPLHIMYSYDDASIVVSNLRQQGYRNVTVRARVLNFDLTEKFSRDLKVNIAPDSVQKLFTIPQLDGLEGVSSTYFVDLRLIYLGRTLSSNFYWLSSKPDVLDWPKSTYYHTPQQQYADLTQLTSLPKIALKVSSASNYSLLGLTHHVTVENPTPGLAFMVHLRITKGEGGEEIRPVIWEDNYFSLLPGEKRNIYVTYSQKDAGSYPQKDAGRAKPVIAVTGWNIAPAAVPAAPFIGRGIHLGTEQH